MSCTCCTSCRLAHIESELEELRTTIDSACIQQNQDHHQLLERLQFMATKIEDLTAQVASNRTVIGSALTLIQGFSAQLDAAIAAAKAGNDQALTDLSASLKTDDDALAAAVAAGTPGNP